MQERSERDGCVPYRGDACRMLHVACMLQDAVTPSDNSRWMDATSQNPCRVKTHTPPFPTYSKVKGPDIWRWLGDKRDAGSPLCMANMADWGFKKR